MPILLLPFLLLALVAALLILLPLSLRQRYRHGSARRRAVRWVLRINAWGLCSSVPVFLAMAWLGKRWSVDAPRDAIFGLLIGTVLGLLGLALTQFEQVDGRLHYTPNRWLVLAVTGLLALRIVIGAWSAWRRASGAGSLESSWATQIVDAGGLWAVGGVLLGYATAYAWGLHRRRMADFR